MTRPVTHLDKTDVLEGLFAEWDAIDALVAGLSEPQWQAQTPLPGWDVHDVVAHIIGVESMLQGAATPEADIDISTLKHVRNDIGVMNERWVRKLRGDTALLDKFRAVTGERRKVLSDISDDVWSRITATPAGPDTYGRFMRVRIFDCWMHEHDIRDALGLPADDADLSGPASRLALDEVTVSMSFVVGKLGGAPDGSRVTIELTGPLRRTINVAIEGRGRVVDDFGGAGPTSTIQLDGVLFTRLAGGRTTPAAHADSIRYGGDEAVAKRIVERLNYVI